MFPALPSRPALKIRSCVFPGPLLASDNRTVDLYKHTWGSCGRGGARGRIKGGMVELVLISMDSHTAHRTHSQKAAPNTQHTRRYTASSNSTHNTAAHQTAHNGTHIHVKQYFANGTLSIQQIENNAANTTQQRAHSRTSHTGHSTQQTAHINEHTRAPIVTAVYCFHPYIKGELSFSSPFHWWGSYF